MGNWLSVDSNQRAETVSEEAPSPPEKSLETSFETFAMRELNNQIIRDIINGFEESLWEEHCRSSHSSSEPESEPDMAAHEPDCEPENLPSEITADIHSWAEFIRLPVWEMSGIEP